MRRRVKLGGKRWIVDDRANLKTAWGYCHYDKKLIQVCRSTLREEKYREILLHECLHAIFPFLAEDNVAEAAIELNNVLTTFEGRGGG